MPSADLTIKRNDTWPPLVAVLTANGAPIDLTSATSVKFIMKGTTILVTGVCSILSAVNGQIQYTWGPTDLAMSDSYAVEFQILWSTGKEQTVPNSGTNTVLVVDDLDDA